MAKVTLTVEGELGRTWMRNLNPLLKRKRLTIQEAVEKGLKKENSAGWLNLTFYLAAIEGVGKKLK